MRLSLLPSPSLPPPTPCTGTKSVQSLSILNPTSTTPSTRKSRSGYHPMDNGHPCGACLWPSHQLDDLTDIARRHNLKLIYDAAHAFGVKINGKSISSYGDLSMFSFHATKLYHSIEGGLLTFNDPGMKQTFDYLKNFGFKMKPKLSCPAPMPR